MPEDRRDSDSSYDDDEVSRTPTPPTPPRPSPRPASPSELPLPSAAAPPSPAAAEASSDRDLVERRLVYKRLLLDGATLRKYGRSGLPHARRVALSPDCRFLTWAAVGAQPDSDARIAAGDVTAVLAGAQSAVFVKNKGWYKDARLCFSLVAASRTLGRGVAARRRLAHLWP
jgi:hypothetical protein